MITTTTVSAKLLPTELNLRSFSRKRDVRIEVIPPLESTVMRGVTAFGSYHDGGSIDRYVYIRINDGNVHSCNVPTSPFNAREMRLLPNRGDVILRWGDIQGKPYRPSIYVLAEDRLLLAGIRCPIDPWLAPWGAVIDWLQEHDRQADLDRLVALFGPGVLSGD